MNIYYRISKGFILSIALISLVFAQNPIPNAGFENWTEGEPDDWLTFDWLGLYDAVSQSEISHSGSYALKGEVVSFFQEAVPPYIATDSAHISISQNYTRLSGYYQFINNGEDAMWAIVELFDAQETYVGVGSGEFGQTSGGYSQFAVNLNYNYGSGQPATSAFIWFSIIPSSESQTDSLSLGSYFLLDDLAFDNVSSISEGHIGESPRTYQLDQNYPNPFNPSTTINFSIPQSGRVNLSIFNSIGQEVKNLINEDMTSGDHQITFNAIDLPSGIYFYKLETGNFADVKKMILIK
jgi:hypothetical protein